MKLIIQIPCFNEYRINPRAFKLKDGTYRDEIIMANIFE